MLLLFSAAIISLPMLSPEHPADVTPPSHETVVQLFGTERKEGKRDSAGWGQSVFTFIENDDGTADVLIRVRDPKRKGGWTFRGLVTGASEVSEKFFVIETASFEVLLNDLTDKEEDIDEWSVTLNLSDAENHFSVSEHLFFPK